MCNSSRMHKLVWLSMTKDNKKGVSVTYRSASSFSDCRYWAVIYFRSPNGNFRSISTDSVQVKPPITNISTGKKCPNKLILHNSWVLFHVVVINKLLLLYNKDISNQICIDFIAEINQKLSVAAKGSCNALSAITELI